MHVQQRRLETAFARSHDQDKCIHCRKSITPALSFANGTPNRSFRSYCGNVHRDFTTPHGPQAKEVAEGLLASGLFGLIISGLLGR